MDVREGKRIQSVQRAIDIINCFGELSFELSLGDISRKLSLNKSTVHGILQTLQHNDFVRQNGEGKYRLGSALVSKRGYVLNTERSLLLSIAMPHMMHLSNKYRCTCNLFIMEDERPLFVHQNFPSSSTSIVRHVMDVEPLYATATGKLALLHMSPESREQYLGSTVLQPMTDSTIDSREALLDELRQIEKNGYACENEELSQGVSAVSVPIYDDRHTCFGALSLTTVNLPAGSYRDEMIQDLRQVSATISRSLFLKAKTITV